jgi:catechol 1,2-dioxygenase
LFRAAHLHVKVTHPQYRSLISSVYFEGGEYLESDVANAVREDLIAKLVRREDPNDLAARGLTKPYFEVRYDFVLVPQTSRTFGRVGCFGVKEQKTGPRDM